MMHVESKGFVVWKCFGIFQKLYFTKSCCVCEGQSEHGKYLLLCAFVPSFVSTNLNSLLDVAKSVLSSFFFFFFFVVCSVM